MGLCETSTFSIFTFSCAVLAICTRVLTATVSLSHDEVLWFEWKRLQIDDVTLWYSIDLISVFAFLFCCELYGCSRFYSFSRADVMFPCRINSGGNSGLQKHRCETALCSLSRFCSERSLSIRITYPTTHDPTSQTYTRWKRAVDDDCFVNANYNL